MTEPHSTSPSDRNLLFGILALQMNFASRDGLVAAMNAWVLNKNKSLGDILFEQGEMSDNQKRALDALIEQHLAAHENSVERSVYALGAASSVRALFTPVGDFDLQATLAKFELPSPETTRVYEAGDQGGRYRILRPHARGGLGEVFVAHDTELNREVALKEIQANRVNDPASRHRFVLEAEITGGLEHPGIVPVYGLGAYADGRPYYAMRFIRGQSFKEAIEGFHASGGGDFRALEFHRLLRRFVDMCNAVAYAHSRGVLHRDLKPANVMLGKFGETLVVDWGLAKAGIGKDGLPGASPLDERPLEPTSASSETQMGARLGTPSYMSPEQAAGRLDDLGPASDIYSLGASLYVLLTGQRPFAGDSSEADVQEGRFVSPGQVRSDVPRPLEAICLKAMALRPSDRYGSALDLAADIEHWLSDEPVSAYPEPLLARAGRWARRHRTALAGAAVFLVSAVVALGASTALVVAEQSRTAEQKNIAEKNYQLSRDQTFNIIELIEAREAEFADTPSLQKTRREILMLASKACARYLEKEEGDLELCRRAAQVYRYTANVHRLGDERDLAEPLYGESVRLYERLSRESAEAANYKQRLSETLRDQAKLRSNVGRLSEAGSALRRSLEIAEQLCREAPSDPRFQRTLAAALLSLASLESSKGKTEETRELAQRAAGLFRELDTRPAGQRHPYDPILLAASLNLVAVSLRESGQPDSASAAHKEAVGLLTPIAKKAPPGVAQPDAVYFLALCQLQQFRTAGMSKDIKRRDNADKGLSASIKNLDTLRMTFPRVPMYRESLGEAYQERGKLRAEPQRDEETVDEFQKRLADARADFELSRKFLEERVAESPETPGPRTDLGRTYIQLGRLCLLTKSAEGPAWFGKAAETLAKAAEQAPELAPAVQALAEARAHLAR